jgi:hypothetical protein
VSFVPFFSSSQSNPCCKWCIVARERLLRRCSGELPARCHRKPVVRRRLPRARHLNRLISRGRSRSKQGVPLGFSTPYTRGPSPQARSTAAPAARSAMDGADRPRPQVKLTAYRSTRADRGSFAKEPLYFLCFATVPFHL